MKVNPVGLTRTEFYNMLLLAINPRPIAWVSTVDGDGVFNVAPFSFFQVVSAKPPVVCFSVASKRDGQIKDTLRNIQSVKDFVINTVSEPLGPAMNQTSEEYPPEVDEFQEVGLTPVKSEMVRSPRVGESPVSLECKLNQILHFGESPEFGSLIIGDVVLVHVKDEFWVDGQIDGWKLQNIGRLWGKYYCRITDTFEMTRPDPEKPYRYRPDK